MSEYNLEDKIVESAKKSQEFVVEKRRDFHRHPEVKFEEKRTAEIVETFLKDWGYETKEPPGPGNRRLGMWRRRRKDCRIKG